MTTRGMRQWVNDEGRSEQVGAVRRSVTKGQPFGSPAWVEQMAVQWNLGETLRERGRLKKELVSNGSGHLFLLAT